ncbi:MAG: transposase [Desulfonatronovibrio sp.]
MGRSRYLITEPERPHFLTCTALEWLPVFSRPEAVQIIFDSWNFLRKEAEMRLYGYVILENHTHFIAQSPDLGREVHRFKSYTARSIIDHLQEINHQSFLRLLNLSRKIHKTDRKYQLWQEGVHAELIMSDKMMRQKLDYIHYNPVKRGYVELPEHWRYSSASNYNDGQGLIEIDSWRG